MAAVVDGVPVAKTVSSSIPGGGQGPCCRRTGNYQRTRSVEDVMRPRLLACSLAAVAVLAACGASGGESDDVGTAIVASDSSGDGLEETTANADSEVALSDKDPAGGSSMRCMRDPLGPLHQLVEELLARGAVTELGSPWDLDGVGSGASFTNVVHQDHLHLAFDG